MKKPMTYVAIISLILSFGMMMYSFYNPKMGRIWEIIFFIVVFLIFVMLKVINSQKK